MMSFEIVSALALIAAFPLLTALVITRLGSGGPTLVDVLRGSDDAWPRGVQEEEPLAWRFDALTFPNRPRPIERSNAPGSRRSGQVVDGIRPTASM